MSMHVCDDLCQRSEKQGYVTLPIEGYEPAPAKKSAAPPWDELRALDDLLAAMVKDGIMTPARAQKKHDDMLHKLALDSAMSKANKIVPFAPLPTPSEVLESLPSEALKLLSSGNPGPMLTPMAYWPPDDPGFPPKASVTALPETLKIIRQQHTLLCYHRHPRFSHPDPIREADLDALNEEEALIKAARQRGAY